MECIMWVIANVIFFKWCGKIIKKGEQWRAQTWAKEILDIFSKK